MNQIWDAARFGRLLRAHMAQSRRAYLWFAGVVAIVDVILLVLMLALATKDSGGALFYSFDSDSQTMWFWVGLYITGIIFATRYFEGLSNPGATLVMLMRPASVSEKWLLAVLVVGVGFPLAFAALYAVLHLPFVMLAQTLYVVPDGYHRNPPDFRIYVPFFSTLASAVDARQTHNDLVGQMIGWLVFTSLQAFCLSGKVFFKRAAVLKMALVAFFVLLLIFILGVVSDLSFSHVTSYWHIDPTSGLRFTFWETVLAQMVLFGVPLMLWGVVFLNLQEREVS